MSAESDLRDALIAYAPLIAVVPAERIGADAVEQGASRPYIAFAKQSDEIEHGLDGTELARMSTIDIQCVGSERENALAVKALVQAALDAADQPSDRGFAGYDAENDLEVEVVTVEWWS
jgi:hypothetical protein